MKKFYTTEDQVVRFRQDIQEEIRLRIREAIEVVVQEELAEALRTDLSLPKNPSANSRV